MINYPYNYEPNYIKNASDKKKYNYDNLYVVQSIRKKLLWDALENIVMVLDCNINKRFHYFIWRIEIMMDIILYWCDVLLFRD